jgi:carbon-monoxide dehydrogenase medium subunit
MQVPSHVEYERPATLQEALALLANGDGDARPLAGGHSLIPMMKLRLARPELLVDINGLTELAYIRHEGGGEQDRDYIAIGALTRHSELLESALVYEHYPIFRDAEKVIADPVVRNWGTIGGSLCQADPSEDLSAAFAAARATVVITSQGGTRTVTARDLHAGPYETVVGPGELLTEIRLPVRTRTGSAYQKVERRVGDWSIVAAGAVLTLTPDLRAIETAGIGLTAVGAHQFAAPEAEDFLAGKPPADEMFAEGANIAADRSNPVSDQRGPADYKRHLVAELTARALRAAYQRATGEA